jgi:molybdopterin-guanine dinucleotide biosynthesis protein B
MGNIVSVIGKSKVGKTTFIEKIIKEMKKMGYRVAAVKHTHHDFEIDYPGKDSYRIFNSGSEGVLILSSKKLALIKNIYNGFDIYNFIKNVFGDCDIIFAEGFKNENFPKIEIVKDDVIFSENILAIVYVERNNKIFNGKDIPFFYMDEMDKIINWIEKDILKGRKNENRSF